jgi:predicted ATPase
MVAKVVAISGAQGAGKSTILKGLMAQGWHVDNFRVSRAVQAQLGWASLDNVTSSWDTMVQFQEEVLLQKRSQDLRLRFGFDGEPGTPSIVLTERSFADIIAYTTYWTWELVDQQKQTFKEAAAWLSRYHQLCVRAQTDCYEGLILLPYMDAVPWEDDPHRASRGTVNNIYGLVTDFAKQGDFTHIPTLTITETSPEARVTQVANFMRTL